MSDTRMVRYLPVQVAGQNYAIRMVNVLAVQSIADAELIDPPITSTASGAAEPDDFAGDAVPVVDLGVLFGDAATTSTNRHAVIVTTPAGSCALVVDVIRAIVSVESDDVQRLPNLLVLTGCPFSFIISVAETLLPVIDVARLLDHVRAVRPDLVAEVNHAG